MSVMVTYQNPFFKSPSYSNSCNFLPRGLTQETFMTQLWSIQLPQSVSHKTQFVTTPQKQIIKTFFYCRAQKSWNHTEKQVKIRTSILDKSTGFSKHKSQIYKSLNPLDTRTCTYTWTHCEPITNQKNEKAMRENRNRIRTEWRNRKN